MPLDGAALGARARPAGAAAGAHDALPEGARRLRRRRGGRRRRRLHAGGAAVRRRRGGGRHGRRRSASSTSARPAAGRPRRGGDAEDRGAARGWRRCPSPSRCRSVALPVARAAADRRAGATRRCTGPSVLAPQLAVTVLATGRAVGARAAGRARLSRCSRAGSPALTGWLGAFDVAWTQDESDRPRPVHALQRLHPRLPRAGDRLELPGRPRPLQARTARAWPPAARSAAIDFARARRRAQRALRPRARPRARRRVLRMHQPPQGYFAPGADPVAQAKAVAELAAMVGEFEKPKYFAYKASICAHSRSQKTGCNAVHRRLLDRGDPRRRRPRRASSRTCAWAAARARPSARRAR